MLEKIYGEDINFLMHHIESYSRLNIENIPDWTKILKILRHISMKIFPKYFLEFS